MIVGNAIIGRFEDIIVASDDKTDDLYQDKTVSTCRKVRDAFEDRLTIVPNDQMSVGGPQGMLRKTPGLRQTGAPMSSPPFA